MDSMEKTLISNLDLTLDTNISNWNFLYKLIGINLSFWGGTPDGLSLVFDITAESGSIKQTVKTVEGTKIWHISNIWHIHIDSY